MSLHEATEALEQLGDPSPLHRLAEQLSTPWTVVVVGPTAVGKTTLLNHQLHAPRPTGLGGVTLHVESQTQDGVRWVETPGQRTMQHTGAVKRELSQCDAAIWVVDGLQPLTHSEREFWKLCAPPKLVPHLIISRADLIQDEATAVLQRCQSLVPQATVLCADLRQGWPAIAFGPSNRRQAWITEALHTIACPTEAEVLTEARNRWRAHLDHCVSTTLTHARTHPSWTSRDVLTALARRSQHERPVGMPPAPSPTQRQLSTLLSGLNTTERLVRAAAGQWLADCELAILDVHAQPQAKAWSRLRRALHAVRDDAMLVCAPT